MHEKEYTSGAPAGYPHKSKKLKVQSTAQIAGETDPWDAQQFKHMKEDEYKADTPEAYLKSTYTARPKGQTDEVIKEEDAEEIVAKGAKLAAESVHSHKVPLHEEEKKSLVQKSKHHHKHNKKSHHHKQHTQSLANAPDYRISAWTEDQHDASHPKEWD